MKKFRKDNDKLKPYIYIDIKCSCNNEEGNHNCILEYENDGTGMFHERYELYGCSTCDHGTDIYLGKGS